MINKIKNVMSIVFNVPSNEINDTAAVHQIVGWDSLNHIKLILAIEEEFDIKFEVEEIETMINIPMILVTINSYLE